MDRQTDRLIDKLIDMGKKVKQYILEGRSYEYADGGIKVINE